MSYWISGVKLQIMENPKILNQVQNNLLQNKARRRRELAQASIEEKVKVLVSLQQATTKIDKQVGRTARQPWDIRID